MATRLPSKTIAVVLGLLFCTCFWVHASQAQRAVLYEEDPNNSFGNTYSGAVTWRTEPEKEAPDQPSDLAVRADVEIPDLSFKMTMSFRRNLDPALPASHTAELKFDVPRDFGGGSIRSLPGLLLKSAQDARGTPLTANVAKVTDTFFLVGLSSATADRQRNMQLLKDREWFDIPLVLGDGHRAILAIEKQASGRLAFEQAFAVWEP
jgi:hypothetical protein